MNALAAPLHGAMAAVTTQMQRIANPVPRTAASAKVVEIAAQPTQVLAATTQTARMPFASSMIIVVRPNGMAPARFSRHSSALPASDPQGRDYGVKGVEIKGAPASHPRQ